MVLAELEIKTNPVIGRDDDGIEDPDLDAEEEADKDDDGEDDTDEEDEFGDGKANY